MAIEPIRTRTGKVVGSYDTQTLIYKTTRNSKSHFSYRMGGYGISVEVVDILKDKGCRFIVLQIIDGEEKMEVNTRFSVWLENGVWTTLREQDGRQLFLNMSKLNPPRSQASLEEFIRNDVGESA